MPFNRIILICFAVAPLLHAPAFAQRSGKAPHTGRRYNTGIYHPRQPKKPATYQAAYIGLGGGINNPTGFVGVNFDLAFTQHFSTDLGIGLSSWGYKTGLQGRYYFDSSNRGWAIMGAITYNTGRRHVVLNNIETTGGETSMSLKLEPVAACSISVGYFFDLGRRGTNRFHIQGGYSIPFSAPRFEPAVNNPQLTEKGEQSVRSIAPGGFVLGLGFSFGTGTKK